MTTTPEFSTDSVTSYVASSTGEATTTQPTEEAPTTAAREDGGLGGGAIAGIVIAALVVVAAIVVVIYFIITKRKQKNGAKPMRKTTRMKWSQFFQRLSRRSPSQSKTKAPSIAEVKDAEKRKSSEADDMEVDGHTNEVFVPDPPISMVAMKNQQQAPDIHIEVHDDPTSPSLDTPIPSPFEVSMSGQQYDYPHKQRPKSVEGIMEDIYDHPTPLSVNQTPSARESDVITEERDDIYDMPKPTTESRNSVTNNQSDNEEKPPYVNVEEWHTGPPPVRSKATSPNDVDPDEMVPPPIGHSQPKRHSYVNVQNNGQVQFDTTPDTVSDKTSDTIADVTEPIDKKDTNEYVNAPKYANLPLHSPVYVNETALDAD